MEEDLNELHNLANTAFQNVSNLAPALRHLVANAKIFQKSVQGTCNLAVMFIESLQSIATAATASEGSTKKLGDVLIDIMDAFKEIENMKLELTKLFINEVIIPLESKAENEIDNTKATHKSYNQENKVKTELMEKARSGAAKYRKKSMKKKKPSQKLEDKERNSFQLLEKEEAELKRIRQEGLRKALIEERRIYCFVAERMCSYGRGIVVYNNRISNFVNQKIPDWQQYISRPTELPTDSENIISNPTGYKMGTVKGKLSKSERKESLKRGKSFNNHFPTRYSTIDGRNSRAGSRPSLAAFSIASSNGTSNSSQTTLNTEPAMTPKSPRTSPLPSPNVVNSSTTPGSSPATPNQLNIMQHQWNQTRQNGNALTPTSPNTSNSPVENEGNTSPLFAPSMSETPVGLYVAPVDDLATNSHSQMTSNVVLINKDGDLINRSHSFSSPVKKTSNQSLRSRTESAAGVLSRKTNRKSNHDEAMVPPLTPNLHLVRDELNKAFNVNGGMANEMEPKQLLRALYKHEAQDVSQLSFEKGDSIIPFCEPTSGWQYGENEKTKASGWFPQAFTEELVINTATSEEKATLPPQQAPTRKVGPPVMAKKAARRKLTVASTKLVQPPRASSQYNEYQRCGSRGDVTYMSTSSSVPEMMHALFDKDEMNQTQRRMSNSFQDLNTDCVLELNQTATRISEDQNPGKQEHSDGVNITSEKCQTWNFGREEDPNNQIPQPGPGHDVNGGLLDDSSFDSMPPPPPPPIWDEDTVPLGDEENPFHGITLAGVPTTPQEIPT